MPAADASSIYEEGVANNQVFVDDQVFGTPDYIAPEVILRQGYGELHGFSSGLCVYLNSDAILGLRTVFFANACIQLECFTAVGCSTWAL